MKKLKGELVPYLVSCSCQISKAQLLVDLYVPYTSTKKYDNSLLSQDLGTLE